MAKKFLVNLDMGGLSINNFRAHPASTAPTATASGQLYYDTSTSKLYYSTGTGTGNWTQVVTGTTAVSSLNGNTGSVTINGTTNQVSVTGNATNPIVISLPSSVIFPGKVTFNASTTGASSANLPAGTAPTSPADGDIWRATNAIKFYNGTATKTLAQLDTTGATLDSTITGSSLTSVGTIGTGVWNGTVIAPAYGGTGVANGSNNTITFTGNYTLGLTLTNNTSVTLPTSGTLLATTGSGSSLTFGTGSLSLAGGNLTTATGAITLTAQAGGSSVTLPSSGTLVNSAVTTLSSLASVGTITTGVWNGTAVTTTYGGTGLTSYTAGDLLYYSTGTTLSKLAIGTTNYVLTSSGSAPQYVAQSTLSVGSATNATNTAITDDTTTNATVYPTWVTANTGNLPQKVSSTKLSFNPSTGALTTTGTVSSGGLTSTGTVNFGSASTVTVPTPVNGTDAANKNYVDNVASGVNAHDAVQYATTTTIAGTYAAGTTGADGGTGVGATITYTSTGTTSIDSGANLALNDRVLVKNGVTADAGTTSKANGIYYVTTAGTTGVATVLTRALDADNSIAGDIMAGDLVYIVSGGQGGTQWIQTATGTATTPNKGIKIGTDSITFTQFSGASSTTAGAGLVANGNAFDIGTASSARIVVNADNIDLATVSRTDTPGTPGINFIQSLTTDSYGRVTASVAADVRDATTSVKGIASFNSSMFSVSSGAVSLANTAVTAASYGASSDIQYPTFTVDAQGRLTAAATTTIRNAAADGSTKGVAAFSSTGFSASSGVISFATGTTSAGANDVGSSYTYATQKATATLTGTGSKSSWTISHNLNSRDIQVQVYQTSATPDTQYAEVEVDIVRTAAGTVTVTFAAAPALNDTYNVVMVG